MNGNFRAGEMAELLKARLTTKNPRVATLLSCMYHCHFNLHEIIVALAGGIMREGIYF